MNEPAVASDLETLRAELAAYIRANIPLTREMGLDVAALDGAGLTLSAPLAPNINDKGTAFGGSLNAALTLAGWCVTRALLHRAGCDGDVVIAENRTRFTAPADGDFRVTCAWPASTDASDFIDRFRQRGRARLNLACAARVDGRVVAEYTGRYAALKPSGATA